MGFPDATISQENIFISNRHEKLNSLIYREFYRNFRKTSKRPDISLKFRKLIKIVPVVLEKFQYQFVSHSIMQVLLSRLAISHEFNDTLLKYHTETHDKSF